MTKLAWNSAEITLDSFLQDYCLHIYGEGSAKRMVEGSKMIVRRCYRSSYVSGGDNVIAINEALYKYKSRVGSQFSYTDESFNDAALRDFTRKAHLMKEGIEIVLAELEPQQDNLLFANDMFYYTKQYIAFMFNIHFLNMHKVYNIRDKDEFETHAGQALNCLVLIEKLLSTRQDHSLKVMIDEVMSVPRANPYAPETIRQSCINWDYLKNDVYEEVKFIYRKLVVVGLHLLVSVMMSVVRS